MALWDTLVDIRELGSRKLAEEFSGIAGWGKKKTFNTMFAPIRINFKSESDSYSLTIEKDGEVILAESASQQPDCSFEGPGELLDRLFTDQSRAMLSELESTGKVRLQSFNTKGNETLLQLRKLFR